MKIPFDIKYRPQIESEEYKVETRDGRSVRIVCWDRRYNDQHKAGDIIGLVDDGYGEAAYYFNLNGTHWNKNVDKNGRSNFDLFIITPDPELSEFEDKLRIICENAVKEAYLSPWCTSEDFAKNHAAELLDLARKELCKELQTHEDHVDSFIGLAISSAYERGKAEALKDLPRWMKCADCTPKPKYSNEWIFSIDSENVTRESAIVHKGYFLPLDGLEKLPGFNE